MRGAMNRREVLRVSAGAGVGGGVGAVVGGGGGEGGVGRQEPYILGADVSWLLEDEAEGATYWDRGVQKDPLAILKSYGFNWIRARVFVNPHAVGGYAAGRDQTFC